MLHLDQGAASLEYDTPTNAQWVNGEDESVSVLFYPELMIPHGLPYPISPFVVTTGNYKDIREYQRIEGARRHVEDKLWPMLQRVYVHFENGNIDLMKKDAAELTGGKFPDLGDDENRAGWLMALTKHYFDFFVIDPTLADAPGKAAALATVKHEAAIRGFSTQYVSSGRMSALLEGDQIGPSPVHGALRKPPTLTDGQALLAGQ